MKNVFIVANLIVTHPQNSLFKCRYYIKKYIILNQYAYSG